MKTTKNYLLPVFGFTILVIALVLATPLTTNAVPGPNDVRVVNTTAEPVPTAAQGTTTISGNVSVTNTPTVNFAPGASVTVGNSSANPVPVVNINDAGQPFQATVSSIQPPGLNVSTATIATVPAGKRLVIEFVTMTGQLPAGQSPDIMEMTTVSGSGGVTHPFVIQAQPPAVIGDSVFRVNQSLRLYANPSTGINVLFRRNSGAGQASWFATISGYLVDM